MAEAGCQHLQRLTNHGVDWFSYLKEFLRSTGPFRDAVLAILAGIAKQERVRISERATDCGPYGLGTPVGAVGWLLFATDRGALRTCSDHT